MNVIKLDDLNIFDFGNTIGLTGNIWTGNDDKSYITLFPDFKLEDIGELNAIVMDSEDWKRLIRQTDLLEQEILTNDNGNVRKVTVRKTARLIDNRIQWKVFERDNYTCRYTGETGIPLSVDHIDLYNEGGANVEENLLSVSRKANKIRGEMPYDQWIVSDAYQRISKNLPEAVKQANLAIVAQLPHLKTLRVANIRSR